MAALNLARKVEPIIDNVNMIISSGLAQALSSVHRWPVSADVDRLQWVGCGLS